MFLDLKLEEATKLLEWCLEYTLGSKPLTGKNYADLLNIFYTLTEPFNCAFVHVVFHFDLRQFNYRYRGVTPYDTLVRIPDPRTKNVEEG